MDDELYGLTTFGQEPSVPTLVGILYEPPGINWFKVSDRPSSAAEPERLARSTAPIARVECMPAKERQTMRDARSRWMS
jgi:hypothetical protein